MIISPRNHSCTKIVGENLPQIRHIRNERGLVNSGSESSAQKPAVAYRMTDTRTLLIGLSDLSANELMMRQLNKLKASAAQPYQTNDITLSVGWIYRKFSTCVYVT